MEMGEGASRGLVTSRLVGALLGRGNLSQPLSLGLAGERRWLRFGPMQPITIRRCTPGDEIALSIVGPARSPVLGSFGVSADRAPGPVKKLGGIDA